MSGLPEVRRADCGHGFLPIDTPPAAVTQNGMHQIDVYLCDDCRERLNVRKVETKVETKVVRPEPTMPSDIDAQRVRQQVMAASPHAKGVMAAAGNLSEEDCPYTDRRTKDAKDWLKGFREAKDG